MPQATGENPFDLIGPTLVRQLDFLSTQMADTVREWISVDVEYDDGGIIRSQPGEHPRREFGRLYESIAGEVSDQTHTIIVTVDSDCPYAARLQGTLDRPIFTGLIELYEPQFMDVIADAIAQHSATATT